MKKLGFKAINHFENLFWISFELDDASAVLISEMVKAFDRGYPKKEGLLSEQGKVSPSDQLRGTKMVLRKDLSRPDDHGVYGILLGDEHTLDLMLLKNHPLFERLMSHLEKRVAL